MADIVLERSRGPYARPRVSNFLSAVPSFPPPSVEQAGSVGLCFLCGHGLGVLQDCLTPVFSSFFVCRSDFASLAPLS